MTVAFFTLGCKVNTYETEALKRLFEAENFEIVDYKAYADVYIINTCTVTNQSDVKSRKAIRQAVKRNPEAVVAVMGCYSQIDSETVASIDGVDIVIGTSERGRILPLVQSVLRDRKQIVEVNTLDKNTKFDRLNVNSFSENTRAFIKIQDGCNQYCSYCIIPYARGPIRSRELEDVLEEASSLIEAGYQEIVLTGIHTGGYGHDLESVTFYDLLVKLSSMPKLKRLRISSIEINQLSEDILHLIKDNDVFAKHLHIPIQSGSDRILKAMRRRYTLSEYEAKIQEIRALMPSIAITTDIIVGYPGETDEDFEMIKDTVKRIGFSEMHVFPYSRRSGTKAAQEKVQVHGTKKSIRVNELLTLNETLAKAYITTIKEKPQHVLFERCDGEQCFGHTSRYVSVNVKTQKPLVNTIHAINITKVNYPTNLAEFI